MSIPKPVLLVLLCLLALFYGEQVSAADKGKITIFKEGEVAYESDYVPPDQGWKPAEFSGKSHYSEAWHSHENHQLVLWVKFRYHNEAPSADNANSGLQALALSKTSQRFVVFLNGVDIYHSNDSNDTISDGWNRPWLLTFPEQLLIPGENIIAIRVESRRHFDLKMGDVLIGPYSDLQPIFGLWWAQRILGPEIINAVLFVMTLGILLFWLSRRKEVEFGWLALVGLLWMFRNLHYYVAAPPFEPEIFRRFSVDVMFILMAALYGFAATFFNIANKQKILKILGLIAGAIILFRLMAKSEALTDTVSYFSTIPLAIYIIYVFYTHAITTRRLDNYLMFAAIVLAVGLSIHDLGYMLSWWTGADFYMQPYASLLVFGAFSFALGRRVLRALAIVEDVNLELEQRISEAVQNLNKSEAIRRELEVNSAIEAERERMMFEIHDGIGSNLITALSIAEKKKASPDTIALLKRSLTDLKIAVDSLEPVEGDVVVLLANLRHRLEPELRAAGLSFKWNVKNAPPITWLDAVSALHVLRILQEAMGNILLHSGAKIIEVECGPCTKDNIEGVEIIIGDQGKGFDPSSVTQGKGIKNMSSRALAIKAGFTYASQIGQGTRLILWLPCSPSA